MVKLDVSPIFLLYYEKNYESLHVTCPNKVFHQGQNMPELPQIWY